MKAHRTLLFAGLLVLTGVLLACGSPAPAPGNAPIQAAASPSTSAPLPQGSVNSVNLTVKGTDVIYLAGRDDISIPPLGAETPSFPLLRDEGAIVPESFPTGLAISPNAVLSFKVTGGISYMKDAPPIGPDSLPDSLGDTDSLGGISRYTGPAGALVGVFLSDANPKGQVAPEPLDFSENGIRTQFSKLTPTLGQVFFIGDGLTGEGTGAPQTFVAPAGATRLFLGIADALLFFGPPGFYGDNVGSFQVQVASSSPLRLLSTAPSQPTTASKTVAPQPTAKVSMPPASPSATTRSTSNLVSYRIRLVKRAGTSSGAIREESTSEVVLNPVAAHYLFLKDGKPAMEVIVVGDSVWTKIMDQPWRMTKQADLGQALSQIDASGAAKAQEGVPLETSLQWLLGQPKLSIAKGGITPAGDGTVNDVACKQYTVNSTYFYTATLPAPVNMSAKVTYRDQGEIWTANQSGWQPFVVRARLTETITTERSGASSVETWYIEEDVTDINSPNIQIKPPQ